MTIQRSPRFRQLGLLTLITAGAAHCTATQNAAPVDAGADTASASPSASTSECSDLELCTSSSNYICSNTACAGTSTINASLGINMTQRTCVTMGASTSCSVEECSVQGVTSGTFDCTGDVICHHEWGGGTAPCEAAVAALEAGVAPAPDAAVDAGTCSALQPSSDGQFVVGWSINGSCAPSACSASGVTTILFTVTAADTGVITDKLPMLCDGGDGSFEGTIGGPWLYDVVVGVTAEAADGGALTTTATVHVAKGQSGTMRFDFSPDSFLSGFDAATAVDSSADAGVADAWGTDVESDDGMNEAAASGDP